ncbi:tape measure protein [Acinetobacter sp. NIPH 1869]|uniref:tape measure protein n=1 Tax=Acinetobacter higginsii TaxID=70347 RepID=UPI001F4AAA5F|nr:tape measure protein [Acinetobacter higginsii]MCH7305629.1 tape measure protein [Acinetobacter higginsii]
MATVIESLLVSLGFKVDTAGATEFLNSIKELSKSANEFSDSMNGAISSTLGVAATIGKFFTENTFIQTANNFEKLEQQLTRVEGSSTKAKAACDWVTDFAQKTPYDINQVTAAFSKLKSEGLEPQKNGLLESIGNMASATGQDLNQAIDAVINAQKGKFESINDFGINASKNKNGTTTFKYKIDGKDFTKTAASTSQDIQNALQEVMSQKFKGGMDELSSTWDVTLSNLKENWLIFQNDVMRAGVFESLKDKLNLFLSWIQNNKKIIEQWASNIGRVITHVFDRINSLVNMIAGWAEKLGLTDALLSGLKLTIGYVATALLGFYSASAAVAIFQGLATAAGLLTSPFMLAAAALGMLMLLIDNYLSYREGGDSIISELIAQFPALKSFTDFVNSALSTIEKHAGALAITIGILAGAFVMIKAQVISAFLAIKAEALLSFLVVRVNAAITYAVIAAQAIASAIATAAAWVIAFLPFVLLAALIAAAIAGFWWLYNNWAMVWEAISNIVGGIVESIIIWIDLLKDGFFQRIELIKEFFAGLGDSIISIWSGVTDYIFGLFDSIFQKWEAVKGFLVKAKNLISWGAEEKASDSQQKQSSLFMSPYLKRTPDGLSTVTNNNVQVNVPTSEAASTVAKNVISSTPNNTVKKQKAAMRQ